MTLLSTSLGANMYIITLRNFIFKLFKHSYCQTKTHSISPCKFRKLKIHRNKQETL